MYYLRLFLCFLKNILLEVSIIVIKRYIKIGEILVEYVFILNCIESK